jgi:hypothetical protein
MLKRIETSEVIRRATQAFDEHNRNCPEESHQRKTVRGEITVSRRVGIIPEAVTTTFHTILTEYVHSYNRTREILPLHFQDPANPPALLTNNIRIAKFARCTDRTVRNHVTRLRELGFIETKFRGSKRDFQVWITPGFLFGEQNPEIAKNAPQADPSPLERKIFPHNSTHRETLEKEKGSADMLIIHGEGNQGQRGRTEAESSPLTDGIVSRREDREGAGGSVEISQFVPLTAKERQQQANVYNQARSKEMQAKRPKPPRNVDQKYLRMLFDFWLYAWKVLYPAREFSKEQQEKALSAISEGVFESFSGNWTDQEWSNYYQVQMAKLDKAGRYYDNHPDAYLPDPYAVHIPGKGYFDSVNLKGFIGIDAWIKKDSIRHSRQRQAYADKQEAKARRAETLLRTARRDFEKLRINAKPRKEVTKFNQMSMFQYYNAVFAGLGKKWQAAFCNQYLEQQSRDFQAPVYYKTRRLRTSAGEPATVVMIEPWMHDDGEGYYVN